MGTASSIWKMNTKVAKEPSSRKNEGQTGQRAQTQLGQQKRPPQSGKPRIRTQSQQPGRPTERSSSSSSSTTATTTTKQPAIPTQSGQPGIPKQSTEQFSQIETSVEFGTSKTQKNVRQVQESSSGKQKGLGRTLEDHEYMSHTKSAYSKEELKSDQKMSSTVMFNREEDKSTPDESFKYPGNVILVQSADDEGTTGDSHGAGGDKKSGNDDVSHKRGDSKVTEEAKNTCSDATSSEQDDTSDTESLIEENAFSKNMTSTERGNDEIEDESSSCSSYDDDPEDKGDVCNTLIGSHQSANIVQDKIIDSEGESDVDNVLGASGAVGCAFRGTTTGEGLDVDDADTSRSHGGDGDASCAQGDDYGYADEFGVSSVARGDYSGGGSDDESVGTDDSHGVISRVGSVDGSGRDVEHCDSFSARDGGNDDVKFEIADRDSSGGDSNSFRFLGRAGSGGARVVSTASSGDGCGVVRDGDDDDDDDGDDDNQCSCPGEDENDRSDDNEENGDNTNDDHKYDGDGDDDDDDDDDDNNDGTLVAEDNQFNRDNDLSIQPDKVEPPKPRQVPYPVNVDVMEYIESKHEDKFHSFLKDKGIKFIREPGAKLAHFECQGDESESVTALSSFLGDFKTCDVPIDEVYWNCVVDSMSSICSGLGDTPPLVKRIESEKKLRIVSFESVIDQHMKRLQVQLKKVEKEAAFVCETVSAPPNCDPKVLIFLLKKINFEAKRIAPECKNVKVIYDDDNEKIQFKGPKAQVKTAIEIFDEQIGGTTKHQLKLPQTILEFLSTEEGQEAIERTINHREIDAVVLFDDPLPSKRFSATLFGLFNKDDIACIRNIAAEEKIKVEESNLCLKTTPDWKKLCKEIKAENGVFIRESESGSVLITGLAEGVRKGAGMMQEFLHKNSIEHENYVCQTSDIAEYIIKYCKEDLGSIETSLEEFDFHVLDYEGQTLYMSGRRKGLQQAMIKLDELKNSLVVCSIDGRGPGLQKYLEKDGKGERWVKTVQHHHECLIQIENTFDQKTPRQNPVPQTGGKTWYENVRIIQGDLTKESQTDAILNVIASDLNMTKTGSLSAAVVQAAGSGIEEEFRRLTRQTKHPAALMTSGGKLKVPHIIHIIPSSSHKHTIRKYLEKGLRLAKGNGIRSISLPAVGTGWYGLSASDSASLILKSLSNVWGSCTSFPYVNIVLLQSEFMSAFQQEKQKYMSPKIIQKEAWCEKVEIVQGDLTKESHTDAVVNVIASDMNTSRDGSLSAVVVRAAGSVVENEFRSHLFQSKQPAAVVTSGGKLIVPHIIHIIPSSSDKQEIKKSLEEGLRQAKERNMRSISLPAVGTGWYGLSASASASIIFQALRNVWGSYSLSSKVRIVILQRDLMSAFEKEKQKYLPLLTIQGGSRRNTKMKHVKTEVEHGDLISENSDAIVNIINSDMNMENAGELSKAIARVCGDRVMEECKQLGRQRGGSVAMTSGGALNVKHIIHLIPESSDVKHLQMCLVKCLQFADSERFGSISLPAIGTGGYGMSPVISANMIFQAIESFSSSCANIRKIRVVIKQESMLDVFRQEHKRRQGASPVAVSTKPTNQTVRVMIIGKNQESVESAVSELRKDFSESCASDEVEDDGVSDFSESQIDMLIREAENCDVEMTIEASLGYITLRGNKDDVHSMTKRIHKAISEARERERKQQEQENAQMISNTIQWSYALQTENIPFDSEANLEIERAYTSSDTSIEVSSYGENFSISFQGNTGYKHPPYQQISVTRKLKGVEGISLPEHWKEMTTDVKDFITVPLDKNSTEYAEVSQTFHATVKAHVITSIERIQNTFLFKSYMLKKANIKKVNGWDNERRLFHATSPDAINSINTQGFNRSHGGESHGVRFGKGVYFARDASLSLRYIKKSDPQHHMYRVRVLVGQYCEGDENMIKPPPKNVYMPHILYDSTVNKPVNPEEFVIYHDSQCYPEYLITFS